VKLKAYFFLWLILVALMAYESFQLNWQPSKSLLMQAKPMIPAIESVDLNPTPGWPLSLALGWTGFGLICVTNLYIIRKRLGFLKKLGRLGGWLDFHIFCGMLGPTLIVFHSNFKIGGLVAISFWSMVIVAVSGVVGRYFYGQVIKRKSELSDDIQNFEQELQKMQGPQVSQQAIAESKFRALKMVGADVDDLIQKKRWLSVMGKTVIGDMRLLLGSPRAAGGMPTQARIVLKKYALTKRRFALYEGFQKALGYWHSFHLPFAYFMYFVAVIHIVTALLFGVKH